MKNVQGKVFKYGDNVDTDVIIPARYLNTPDANALAAHCMEDIDKDFVKQVKPEDITVIPLSKSVVQTSTSNPFCRN